MVGHGLVDNDFVPTGRTVGHLTHFQTDSFYKALSKKGIIVGVLHIEDLILQRRASAVDYQYNHSLIILLKIFYQSCKVKHKIGIFINNYYLALQIHKSEESMRRELYLFAAALLFISGNLTAGYIFTYTHENIRTAAAVIFLLCTSDIVLILKMKKRLGWIILTAFPFLGASGAAAHEFFRPGPESSSLSDSHSLTLKGIIYDGGLSSSRRPYLEVELENEKTIIYNIPAGVQWKAGDTVTASGLRCSRVENFTLDFDYRRWMEMQGVFYTCFYRHESRLNISHCSNPAPRFIPSRLRKHFSSAVDSLLPSEDMAETRAVVKALAYGYQEEIPSDIEESFRQSGAIHLLAISGMHLGLFYGLLSYLLAFAGNAPAVRRVRSILIILTLWAFTIFTGCGVSILRAAVMFSIYEAGALFGRARSGINSMALSAVIITIADPDAPSGLSFQLSYAAMTAIFLIYPHLRAIVPTRRRITGNIVDICAMTVACQITTAPIIYLHFKTFAFFSLLANLLCTPLVSLAMALIPTAFAASWLGDIAADAAAGLLRAVVKIFIDINNIISNL